MNTHQITLVQASAGSGKTYNLAKRYLYLLLGSLSNIDIKNIIAVTFTNKAAVEMKYRVLYYLKIAAISQDSSGFFSDLKISQQEVSKKSFLVLQNILEHYDNFNISTLDSFKNSILKACAINMDISPNFSIEQDYSQTLKFALEIFLHKSNISQNIRDIILKYLDQYLTTDMGWFAKDNIYNEVKKVFEKSGSIGKNINFSKNNEFSKEFYSRIEFIIKKIKYFADKVSDLAINSYFLKAVNKVLLEGNKIFFSMDIPSKFACENLEYKKNSKISQKADILWEEICQDIKKLCDFYMRSYYQIYSHMYHEIIKEFDSKSKKDAIIFLSEINKKTVKFFKDNNAIIPEVYYRLSEKYKHFLIDEFQDTSFVQWVGIKGFLEESLSTGGTLFCVGDAKQSIYSFRGANPELFYNMSKEFSTSLIKNQYLQTNFRSSKEIVSFNNEVFSLDNLQKFLNIVYKDCKAEVSFENFLNTYKFSHQKVQDCKESGYVEIDFIEKNCLDVKEEIKQKFIKYIVKLLSRVEAKNIAVLCRSNEDILDISSWLLEKNIEVESSQTLNIKNNDIIKQIISFLEFINSPIDSLSFAAFITGDIFSKIANVDQAELDQFLFDNKGNKTNFLYKIFKDKYKNLWNEYFEYFFIKAGFIPVYELILAILERFKILENNQNYKCFIMRFLEVANEFEVQKHALSNFLGYFHSLSDQDESLYIKNAFGNGVQIMTVHKSKGLQFPVVIIPFLKLSTSNIDKPYLYDSKEEIEMLNISKNIAKFSIEASKIYNKEKIDSLLSEINILYVSMTRAEYEIYAIVPPKAGVSNNLVHALFKNINLQRGIKQKYNFKILENNYVYDKFSSGYKDIVSSFVNKKSPEDMGNIKKRGVILHYCLSKLKIAHENLEYSIDNALEITKRKFPLEDTGFLKVKLHQIFSKSEILELFNSRGIVYNEKEIISAKGEIFRIDKLIELSDRVLILDFKSSEYNLKESKEQLLNYVSLVSEIYPSKKVIAYILNIEDASLVQI